MSKIDVIMPQMGESIAEGTLSRWMKKAGDTVQRDEPIFEISTDKVDAEIPSPSAGVLAEILVQEGRDGGGADGGRADRDRCAPRPRRRRRAQRRRRACSRGGAGSAAGARLRPRPPGRLPRCARPGPAGTAPAAAARDPQRPARCDRRQRERRVARGAPAPPVHPAGPEDGRGAQRRLSAIPGTGLAGRVTKNDILSHLESGAGGASG